MSYKINRTQKKSSAFIPELGQYAFGNPIGRYECPPLVHALLDYLLEEIGRVFWNQNQEEWESYEDPEIKGIEVRRYYWGEDEKEAIKPNFRFKDVEIRWYKYPGRGMSVNKEMSAEEWETWFEECLDTINKADRKI